MYSAIVIALWFIKRFEKDDLEVSELKIQKLLYFSEAWNQFFTNKELFKENIEAWSSGPVVPSVFYSLKEFNSKDSLEELTEGQELKKDVIELLEDVYETYANISDEALTQYVQRELPWIEARIGFEIEERCHNVIPKNKIKNYFLSKYFQII